MEKLLADLRLSLRRFVSPPAWWDAATVRTQAHAARCHRHIVVLAVLSVSLVGASCHVARQRETPGLRSLDVPRGRQATQVVVLGATGAFALGLAPAGPRWMRFDEDLVGSETAGGVAVIGAFHTHSGGLLELGASWARLLDGRTLAVAREWPIEAAWPVLDLASELLPRSGDEWFAVGVGGVVQAIRMEPWSVTKQNWGCSGQINAAVWDASRRQMVVLYAPNRVEIISPEGDMRRRVRALPVAAVGEEIVVSGRILVIPTADDSGRVLVVDVETLEVVEVWTEDVAGRVRVAATPGGEVVATVSGRPEPDGRWDCAIRVRRMVEGAAVIVGETRTQLECRVDEIGVLDRPMRVVLAGPRSYAWDVTTH